MAIVSNDLLMGESLFQQVYLAFFGGNIEANTRGDELITEERFDWWGNSLFFPDIPNKQFNSNTERTILNVVMNSSGRLSIIQAMNEDLQYLSNLLTSFVDVEFISNKQIRLIVNFIPKGTQENKTLQLIYDNAKGELIIEKTI